VPEGLRVFTDMSVDENLRAGASVERDRAELASTRDEVRALIPALAARLRQRAATLSGGEQQMLAID
jgi:branched-chain amino acid transport system ATP-binding protein